jgi:hypothetical protein
MIARSIAVLLFLAGFAVQHAFAGCIYLHQFTCSTTEPELCTNQDCDIQSNTCDDKVETEDTGFHFNGFTTTNNGTQGYDVVVAPWQTPCGVTYACTACEVEELGFSGKCGDQVGEEETWIDKWHDYQPTGNPADLCP